MSLPTWTRHPSKKPLSAKTRFQSNSTMTPDRRVCKGRVQCLQMVVLLKKLASKSKGTTAKIVTNECNFWKPSQTCIDWARFDFQFRFFSLNLLLKIITTVLLFSMLLYEHWAALLYCWELFNFVLACNLSIGISRWQGFTLNMAIWLQLF